jgi:3-oxoacyl-[acyl-carrier-protein] synthase III
MLRMGGSYAPRDIEMSYFYIHGDKLFDAFDSLGSDFLNKALHESGKTWDDFTFIGTHQVALPYLETIKHKLGIPEGKANITIKQRGNIASCTLPAQIVQALQTGQLKKGDDYALIGLAGGISIGLMTGTW